MKTLKWIPAILLCGFLADCTTDDSESSPPPPPYTEMYLVGDATTVGWNIKEPIPMAHDGANPYIWTWEGTLYSGELKIPTYAGTWSADYFMPLEPAEKNLSLTTTHLVVNGNPDYKWLVTDSTWGDYRITLNTRIPSIEFKRLAPPDSASGG